jgi:predicted cobalt transporter CbtA
MSARSLLVRGMLVGVVAGLLAVAFGSLFGEPQINQAIAYEAAHSTSNVVEPMLVTRAAQATFGLGVAVLVYGAALGGIFALAFAFSYGRLGRFSARVTSLAVAGGGFIAAFLVPFLKYPANPPAIGNADTIGRRTGLYFLMIVIAVAALVASALLGRSLAARLGSWNATLVAAGAFVVLVGAAAAAMPAIDEAPADFSATLLWRFRLASVGTQLVLWSTFGLLFGALTERAVRRGRTDTPPAPVG